MAGVTKALEVEEITVEPSYHVQLIPPEAEIVVDPPGQTEAFPDDDAMKAEEVPTVTVYVASQLSPTVATQTVYVPEGKLLKVDVM